MPLLEVKSLVKSFRVGNGSFRAVDNVDLQIQEGETVGLVGESGCGKTTFSRCILHLEKPDSGSVVFDGIDVGSISGSHLLKLRREMQIVFQDPYSSLDPRWTVSRIIDEPLRVHNIVPRSERSAEIGRLLDTVGLSPSVASRYPHEFSGGQRQRIGIARALAVQPKFLIADEPVSALDISVRAHILNLLRDIQRQRSLSILFIAHDLAAVKHISNRIAVMYKGKIVEQGPSDSLFTNTSHPYTHGLIDSIPSMHPVKIAKEGSDTVTNTNMQVRGSSNRCIYADKCKYAQDLCVTSEPPVIHVAVDHFSRCHFAKTLNLAPSSSTKTNDMIDEVEVLQSGT